MREEKVSLINDMLLDLQVRRADENKNRQQIPIDNVHPVAKRSTAPGPLKTTLILAMLIAAVPFCYFSTTALTQYFEKPSAPPNTGKTLNYIKIGLHSSFDEIELALPKLLDDSRQVLGDLFRHLDQYYFELSESQQNAKVPSMLEESPRVDSRSLRLAENSDSANVTEQPTALVSAVLRRSNQSLDREVVRQANLYVVQGEAPIAEKLLLQAILENTEAILSAQYLIDFYYDNTEISKLESLVNANLISEVSVRAYALSKYFSLIGEKESAILALNNIKYHSLAEEKILSWLAGLHHLRREYEQAETLYAQLVHRYSGNATYWLGLGVSSEANHHPEKALHAYGMAIKEKIENPEIIAYVQTRVNALSSVNTSISNW